MFPIIKWSVFRYPCKQNPTSEVLQTRLKTAFSNNNKIFYSLTFLKSGLSTDGEIESVRFVGPKAPATYRCRPSIDITSAAAFLASLADSKFNLEWMKESLDSNDPVLHENGPLIPPSCCYCIENIFCRPQIVF